uniref:DNA mismatch repair proteins mutS family domain-containing protein n=1 Tax=viral metagenome TaxID=1070528 RepID=A0A6C0IQV5_9ZZZZ
MPRNNSNKEEAQLRGIASFFNAREKFFKEHKNEEKIMLLQQCGTFYEIYGYEGVEDDPVYEYPRIMHGAAPWYKATIGGKRVVCCGHNTSSIDITCEKLARQGWTVKILKEIGKDSKKRKIHGPLKTISPGTLVPINNNQILTNNCVCVVINYKYNHNKKSPQITIGVSSINNVAGSSKLYEYSCLMPLNDYSASTFEELDRFISINIPKEVWIIHNVPRTKVDDIINFANLNCDRINIIESMQESKYQNIIKETANIETQKEILLEQFNPSDPDFWYDTKRFQYNKYATQSYCLLIKILSTYDNDIVEKLSDPIIETLSEKLIIRTHGLRQLNIINTEHNNGCYSSIERLTNKCKTNMGRRSFHKSLTSPTTNIESLEKDYDTIEHILNNNDNIVKIRKLLSCIDDLELLYRRFVHEKATPLDIGKFYDSLCIIKEINDFFDNDKQIQEYIVFKNKKLSHDDISKLISLIEKTFNIDVCKKSEKIDPEKIFFNRGIYKDLDKEQNKWIDTNEELKRWKNTFEAILKIDNSVHIHQTEKSGMFLKASSKRCDIIVKRIKTWHPDMANFFLGCNTGLPPCYKTVKTESAGDKNKKFVSHDLKLLYASYSQSYDNIAELLNCKFKCFIRDILLDFNIEIESIVNFVNTIDIIYNKAYISRKYNYCKPMTDSGDGPSFFHARDLRHPLVEHIQTNETYVSNDIHLGIENSGMCLFGVNTSGKSTIIKSVGIAIIMAQSGMYVPASEFIYKPYRSLFTRILSNDNLFKCLSSFATEMSEFQYIEEFADENSLVLGDELCNGTETDSAVSIFAAGLLALNKRKTSHIFATHLHSVLEIKRIQNLEGLDIKHLEVKYDDITNDLIYKRKLMDGVGLKTYGLEVCKQFNFSETFLQNARDIRNEIQEINLNIKKSTYNSKKIKGRCEFCNEEGVEVHHLNPQEKAGENGYINTHHKNHKANLANVCKECHHNITSNKIIHERIKTSKGYRLIEMGREK